MASGRLVIILIALVLAALTFFGVPVSDNNITEEPPRCVARTTMVQRAQ
jgi:hypothetical protein